MAGLIAPVGGLVVAANFTGELLILSQVILSMQLSFAVFPLVQFTSDRDKMGDLVNGRVLKTLAYAAALLIAASVLAGAVRGLFTLLDNGADR